jgi:hypothetical protein
MGVNAANSLADPICPTYAAGTVSVNSGSTTGDLLNDSAKPGSANGYINNWSNIAIGVARVGGFNNGWTNVCNSQNITPTYSSGLVSFGNTGRQS